MYSSKQAVGLNRPLLLRLISWLKELGRKHPSKSGLLAILFAVLFWRYKRYQNALKVERRKALTKDSRVTIAFSGSFLLFSYYIGVCAYIKDYFDTSDVRVTGVSGGAISILSLSLNISTARIFALGWHLRQALWARALKVYLISEDLLRTVFVREFKLCGLTDNTFEELSKRDKVYVGVTCAKWLGGLVPVPSSRSLLVSRNMDEATRQVIASMTVLPFFKQPALLSDGSYALDGALSMLYAIPENVNEDKLIRISAWPFLTADVKPQHYSKMHCKDFIYPVGIREQSDQFCLGYKSAMSHHNVFLNKGLKPKPSGGANKNPKVVMKQHVDSFKEIPILRDALLVEDPNLAITKEKKQKSPAARQILKPSFRAGSQHNLQSSLYNAGAEKGANSMLTEPLLRDSQKTQSSGCFDFSLDPSPSADSMTSFEFTMAHPSSVWQTRIKATNSTEAGGEHEDAVSEGAEGGDESTSSENHAAARMDSKGSWTTVREPPSSAIAC